MMSLLILIGTAVLSGVVGLAVVAIAMTMLGAKNDVQ